MPDDELLERSSEPGCILVTQDLGFKGLAEEWQKDAKRFSGLLYGNQWAGTIGDSVECLSLIAVASEAHEWENVVHHIPW